MKIFSFSFYRIYCPVDKWLRENNEETKKKSSCLKTLKTNLTTKMYVILYILNNLDVEQNRGIIHIKYIHIFPLLFTH